MKLNVVYLFLFLILPNLSFSQTKGRVVYKIATEPPASDENDSSRKTFVEFLNSMSEIRDSIPFNLDFDKRESVFYVDTETNLGLSDKQGYESIIKTFNFYYRNGDTKKAVEKIIAERTYLVESKTSDIVWNITNEQKTIGNYTCIKATTTVSGYTATRGVFNKTVEAWFAPSIALPLGPNNYGGLPGLIMELTDMKFTYYVNSMSLEPDFDMEMKKPTRGKTMSREEYYEMQPKMSRENLRGYIGG